MRFIMHPKTEGEARGFEVLINLIFPSESGYNNLKPFFLP